MKKIAVVLFNLGGPNGPDAVRPFLFNLFNDKAIIDVPQPMRWLIANFISAKRAPIAKQIYAHIGGRSPIVQNTQIQAVALQNVLATRLGNTKVNCYLCMRYSHPRSFETAEKVKSWGPDEIILLPLYPQFSTTTGGSSFTDWYEAAKNIRLDVRSRGICCYPTNVGFITAISERLKKELSGNCNLDKVRVLFSAHGLPKKIVDQGDPYKWLVERSTEAVIKQLEIRDLDWRLSYQSRVGRLEWIKPYTEDEIRLAGSEGKGLIIVPIAFVSEHSETLVELDIEYRGLAEAYGVPYFRRIQAVSDDSSFIDGLAGIVEEILAADSSISGPAGQRVCPLHCVRCPISG